MSIRRSRPTDAMGAKGLDGGPQLSAAKAMIAHIKANGGIAGGKIEPVFYIRNFNSATATTQQGMCARFTEENKDHTAATPSRSRAGAL